MAGLAQSDARMGPVPEMRGQFSAIAELRWNQFRHSLRSRRGKAELVSRITIGSKADMEGFFNAFNKVVSA